MALEDFQRVQIECRDDLRAWLDANHGQREGIWLVKFKKHAADKYVTWEEVVEEVLSYGWIDSRTRRLDEDRTMLFLSPRRPGSPWSRTNKEHVERLLAAGRMQPPGLAAIEQAKQDGSWSIYDDIEDLIIPDDLAAALAEDAAAAENFQAFSDSSKKSILWWIKSAKTVTTRRKRIAEAALMAHYNVRASYPEASAFKHAFKRRHGLS